MHTDPEIEYSAQPESPAPEQLEPFQSQPGPEELPAEPLPQEMEQLELGTQIQPQTAPEQAPVGKEKNMEKRKKPSIGVRIVMQVVSLLLCLVLMAVILVSTLLVDVKMLTGSNGIQTIVNAVLNIGTSASAQEKSEPSAEIPAATPSYGIVSLGSTDFEIPDDIEISPDVLTDSNALAEFIYDLISESTEGDVEITAEQVQEFIEQSTVSDYVSEKASGYVQDAMTGEATTQITADEIMNLLEENQELIEETFDITITEEQKDNIRQQVTQTIEEEDLNDTIHAAIGEATQVTIPGLNVPLSSVLAWFNSFTTAKLVAICIGWCLVLIGLLVLLNYYNIPKGLTWSGYGFTLMGLLLCVPVYFAQILVTLFEDMMSSVPQIAQVLESVVSIISPVHHGVAIFGAVLLIGSYVWRIILRSRQAEE